MQLTTTTNTIPLPAGALEADEWEVNPDGSVTRIFRGTHRGERVSLEVCGIQDYSGGVLRRVAWLDAGQYGAELDAAGLRQLAADCVAAADELDRLREMSDDMLSQEPSAVVGIGVLKLLCKEKHCVARLIKPAGHQPTYIQVPGKAQEEWPREQDNKRTAAYCSDCGKWFSTDSFQLARSMSVLVAHQSRHDGSYPLSEDDWLDELRQRARELAPETDTFEEFAEMFGFGNVCERCGRKGLDDLGYTDCDVVPSDDPEAPDILLCSECLKASG